MPRIVVELYFVLAVQPSILCITMVKTIFHDAISMYTNTCTSLGVDFGQRVVLGCTKTYGN